MPAELTVIVKDSEKTLRNKHLIYEQFICSDIDPIVKDCIDKTIAEFKGVPDDIKVKINLEVM